MRFQKSAIFVLQIISASVKLPSPRQDGDESVEKQRFKLGSRTMARQTVH
jgi:hypothetical protein